MGVVGILGVGVSILGIVGVGVRPYTFRLCNPASDRSLLVPGSSSLSQEWFAYLLALLVEEPLELPPAVESSGPAACQEVSQRSGDAMSSHVKVVK